MVGRTSGVVSGGDDGGGVTVDPSELDHQCGHVSLSASLAPNTIQKYSESCLCIC